MKKIIPIVSLIGIGCILTGCNQADTNISNNTLKDNVNTFKTCLENYSNLRNKELNNTKFNKYVLTLVEPVESNEKDEEIDPEFNVNRENLSTLEYLDEEPETAIPDNDIANELQETDEDSNTENNKNADENDADENISENDNLETKQISTLYSLSNDIEDSCDDFCELKEELTSAIIETQNLLTKLQNKEVELTLEEKMFVTEQAMQLKNLSRQLSNITTELSINLSDLNEFMTTSNKDLDTMSIKYLLVLDNLINGNEMLKTGLSSLNLINSAFRMNNMQIPPNNTGRIIYGFQKNQEPPVVKDYLIDENGQIAENKETSIDENTENQENKSIKEKSNTDSYANTNISANIDTYGNNFQNTDTFFNTALLDNEFMYGNGGFGYNGFGMYQNPYRGQYAQYERANKNTTNNANTSNNTQYLEDSTENNNIENPKRKKLKITKNIDTYKDENTPNLKSKWENIKQTFASMFNSSVKPNQADKIKNPIYKESLNIKNDF